MWGLWEFIVYGQVPGTAVQISFKDWLIGMVAIVSVLALWVIIRKRLVLKLSLALLGMYAAFVIRTSTASRLHLRA
jgi:hypothetical protein